MRKLIIILNTMLARRQKLDPRRSRYSLTAERSYCARSPTKRMAILQTGKRAGSRPSAAKGGGARQRQP